MSRVHLNPPVIYIIVCVCMHTCMQACMRETYKINIRSDAEFETTYSRTWCDQIVVNNSTM